MSNPSRSPFKTVFFYPEMEVKRAGRNPVGHSSQAIETPHACFLLCEAAVLFPAELEVWWELKELLPLKGALALSSAPSPIVSHSNTAHVLSWHHSCCHQSWGTSVSLQTYVRTHLCADEPSESERTNSLIISSHIPAPPPRLLC